MLVKLRTQAPLLWRVLPVLGMAETVGSGDKLPVRARYLAIQAIRTTVSRGACPETFSHRQAVQRGQPIPTQAVQAEEAAELVLAVQAEGAVTAAMLARRM